RCSGGIFRETEMRDETLRVAPTRSDVLDGLQHLGDEPRARADQGGTHRAGPNANGRVVGSEAARCERVVLELVPVAVLRVGCLGNCAALVLCERLHGDEEEGRRNETTQENFLRTCHDVYSPRKTPLKLQY